MSDEALTVEQARGRVVVALGRYGLSSRVLGEALGTRNEARFRDARDAALIEALAALDVLADLARQREAELAQWTAIWPDAHPLLVKDGFDQTSGELQVWHDKVIERENEIRALRAERDAAVEALRECVIVGSGWEWQDGSAGRAMFRCALCQHGRWPKGSPEQHLPDCPARPREDTW